MELQQLIDPSLPSGTASSNTCFAANVEATQTHHRVIKELSQLSEVSRSALQLLEANGMETGSRLLHDCLKMSGTAFTAIEKQWKEIGVPSGLETPAAALAKQTSLIKEKLQIAAKAIATGMANLPKWQSTLSEDQAKPVVIAFSQQQTAIASLTHYFHRYFTMASLDLSTLPTISNEEVLARLADISVPISNVNLKGCRNLSSDTLKAIASRCHQLTYLNLSNTQSSHRTLMAFKARMAPGSLTGLYLGNTRARDATIMEMLPYCGELTSVDLGGLQLCKETLLAVAAKCKDKGVGYLNLHATGANDDVVRAFLPKINEGGRYYLDGTRAEGLSHRQFEHAATPLKRSPQVMLGGTGASHDDLIWYAESCQDGSIVDLDLSKTRLTDNTAEAFLPKCRPGGMNSLNLANTNLGHDTVRKFLGLCLNNSLTKLNLRGTKVGNGTLMIAAAKCKDNSLTELDLGGLKPSEAVLRAFLPKCRDGGLTAINLFGTRATKETIAAFAPKCKKNGLTLFDIGDSTAGHDTLELFLPKCQDEALTRLGLKGTGASNLLVRKFLQKCKPLCVTHVDLSDTSVLSDDTLYDLAHYCKNGGLTYLGLAGTEAEDTNLVKFLDRAAPGIRFDLANTGFSQATVDSFRTVHTKKYYIRNR